MAVAGETISISDIKTSMETLQRSPYPKGLTCSKLPPGCVAPPVAAEFLKEITSTQTDLVHAFDVFPDEVLDCDLDVVKMQLEREKPDYMSLPGILKPKDQLPHDTTMQLAIVDIPNQPTHKDDMYDCQDVCLPTLPPTFRKVRMFALDEIRMLHNAHVGGGGWGSLNCEHLDPCVFVQGHHQVVHI